MLVLQIFTMLMQSCWGSPTGLQGCFSFWFLHSPQLLIKAGLGIHFQGNRLPWWIPRNGNNCTAQIEKREIFVFWKAMSALRQKLFWANCIVQRSIWLAYCGGTRKQWSQYTHTFSTLTTHVKKGKTTSVFSQSMWCASDDQDSTLETWDDQNYFRASRLNCDENIPDQRINF